jgi:hypothetical protein
MMQKNLSKIKAILLFMMLVVSVSLFTAFNAADDTAIELRNERLAISPKGFYVANVIDKRTDKVIAQIIPSVLPANKAVRAFNVDIKGGFESIASYINKSLPINKSLRPVVIEIKSLKVKETDLGQGRVNGQIAIDMSFGLQQDDEIVHLVNYKGSANYQRKAGPAQQVEPLLRSTINNSLIYLNNWLNVQADNNIKLAKGVKVFFKNYTEPEEGDTIYYSVNRPLKWTDFQGKPPYSSKYGAAVFASLGYNEDVKLVKGIVNVTLTLKVYAPKSACWVRTDASAYGLSHEQRHFDIVKLVSEHFKQQIVLTQLSTANYDGPINVAYFDALRELDRLQKAYDEETGHSVNTYQQQLWDSKIDKELFALGIKSKTI